MEEYLRLANFLGNIYAKQYGYALKEELIDEALLGLAKVLTEECEPDDLKRTIRNRMQSRILHFLRKERRFNTKIKQTIAQSKEYLEHNFQKMFVRELENKCLYSETEKLIYALLIQGYNLVEIGQKLQISKQRVLTLRNRIRERMEKYM